MGFLSDLFVSIIDGILECIDIVFEFIDGLLDFSRDIVGWFRRKIRGIRSKVAFIINGNNLRNKQRSELGKILDQTVVVNLPPGESIYDKLDDSNTRILGVYDDDSDELDALEIIQADRLDNRTRNITGSEGIVVVE